ncbi:hypothetical protein COXBURSA331_A0716 [Coxiella burnetii RSA 331]|nr:hypothetical protein COXBURSA331_A0716 [Coxiella burnetii RSA 331]
MDISNTLRPKKLLKRKRKKKKKIYRKAVFYLGKKWNARFLTTLGMTAFGKFI